MTKKLNLTLLSIVGIALLLRLFHLTSISLWHDEAFSALLIEYPWAEMMYRIGLDVHPPMYYIFLRIWHYALGDSLWALRGFSVFFGVATVIAVYYLVQQVFKNHRAALIAAALVAINPFQLQYVTEARMYTMGAFFAVLAALFLAKALDGHKLWHERRKLNTPNMPEDIALKRRFLLYYLGYTLSTIIIIYTHYYLLFTAAAICLYGLIYHWRTYKDQIKQYGWLILSYAIIALSFLPWLKVFLFQFKQVGAGYWIPPIDRWSIPDTLWRIIVGLYTSQIPNHFLLVVITIIALFILYRVARKIDHHEKWLVVINIIAPFAGALLFLILARLRGQDSSVYLVRYFLFSSAFLIIATALFLEQLRPRRIAQILLGALVALNLFAVIHYWNDLDIKNKPGMAAAARLLSANVEPQHKLYVASSFEFFNYKYYTNTSDPVPVRPLLYTNGQTDISNIPHYAGTAILTNQDLVPDYNTDTKNGDTVWILWTDAFGGKPPSVPANWTKINEYGYPEVRPYPNISIVVTQYKVN